MTDREKHTLKSTKMIPYDLNTSKFLLSVLSVTPPNYKVPSYFADKLIVERRMQIMHCMHEFIPNVLSKLISEYDVYFYERNISVMERTQIIHLENYSPIIPEEQIVLGSYEKTLLLWNGEIPHYGINHIEKRREMISNYLEIFFPNIFFTKENNITKMIMEYDYYFEGKIHHFPDMIPITNTYDLPLHDCSSVMLDGRIVIGSKLENRIKIWNPYNGKCDRILEGHAASCVASMKNGKIVSGSTDKTLRIWNADTGKCELILKGHNSGVCCCFILSDERIVSGYDDGTIKIWDVHTKPKVSYMSCMSCMPCVSCVTLKGHTDRITYISELSDNRIVSGSNDDTIKIWNAKTEKCDITLNCHRRLFGSFYKFNKHYDDNNCIAILLNDSVVSAASDNRLKIWNTQTGQCERILEGHADSVTCVAVLPDGRIASGSYDNTIKIWDANTGSSNTSYKCDVTMYVSFGTVESITVLSDGRIVSRTNKNSISIWS
jgi:WD40 repeat protein